MVSEMDMTKFDEMRVVATKKYFDEVGMDAIEERPLLYASFM